METCEATFELFLVHSPFQKEPADDQNLCILMDPIIRWSHLATNCYSRYPAPIWSEIVGFIHHPMGTFPYDSGSNQENRHWTMNIIIEPGKTHEESVKITINFLIHWTSIQTSIQTSHVSQFFHGHNMAVTIAGDHRLISACAQRLCGLGDGGFHHGHQIPEASTVPEPFTVFFLKTNGWVHGEDSCTGTSHHKRHFSPCFQSGKVSPAHHVHSGNPPELFGRGHVAALLLQFRHTINVKLGPVGSHNNMWRIMHGPCSHLLEMRDLDKLQSYFQITSQNTNHFFGVGIPHMAPSNNQNI